jgi:hypothetical protein
MHATNLLFRREVSRAHEIIYTQFAKPRYIMRLGEVFLRKFDELIAVGEELPMYACLLGEM